MIAMPNDDNEPIEDLIERLNRDLKTASIQLTPSEMRYLVDSYYAIQKIRIQLGNAAGASLRADEQEPADFPAWLSRQMRLLETRLRSVMQTWAQERVAGRWLLSQVGIGPVLAAGLLAHIDPERAKTAGAVWRFAGLDPTLIWNKGEKRPYNARLKVLCWKCGDSFVKLHNHPKAYYGHLYAARKIQEVERNEAGLFADQAAATLVAKRITDAETKACYEAGRLPPGRLDLRARRYAVKLLLAHFWQVSREAAGLPIVAPFAIEHLGHAHVMEPPGWPLDK